MTIVRTCEHCKREIVLDLTMRLKLWDWYADGERYCSENPVPDPDDGKFYHEDELVWDIKRASALIREEYLRDHPRTPFFEQRQKHTR